MITRLAIAALAMILLCAPQAAVPQPTPAPQTEVLLSEDQARGIAHQNGVHHIDGVEMKQESCQVRGRTAEGRPVEVEIDLRTGRIVAIRRG